MKKERVRIQETKIEREAEQSWCAEERDRIIRELADRKARAIIKKEQRRLDRLKIEARTGADPYATRLMNEAAAAKRAQQNAWSKLARYLVDGTRDDGKRPRVRIVERDEASN